MTLVHGVGRGGALSHVALHGASDESLASNERLAAVLVEKAHQAALRGDYAGAMKQLDEAERIAPRFARVFHYRSNVAYLKGDRATALAALQRALELEPDNPLFRTNLERLEREGAGAGTADATRRTAAPR